MGRLWGGGVLIALALFMVLGFVRSEVDPLEAEVLKMAARNDGRLTAAEVAPVAAEAVGEAASGVFETIVEIVFGVLG